MLLLERYSTLVQQSSGFCTRQDCRNEYNSTSKIFYRVWWGLTEVPRDIPAEALFIQLWGNEITHIPTGVFRHLTQCTRLWLGSNKISSVEKDDLMGLVSLRELSLANNKISSLGAGTFDRLTQCRELLLSSNDITVLTPGLFLHLTQLYRLDLGLNKIIDLTPGSLDGLQRLRVLYLEGNRLTAIRRHMFAGLNFLQQISIGNNKISTIEGGTWDSVQELTQLTLFRNNLTTLSPDLFTNLLRYFPLNLAMSSISSISSIDNPWDCSSLCWLKHEEQLGTVGFAARPYVSSLPPRCTDGTVWETLQCGDPGE